MATTFRSKMVACVSPANPPLQTHTLFDASYKQSVDSPLDEFLTRLAALNVLAPKPTSWDPIQGQLVLLGAIAAVESFIRTLFRRLISMDAIAQESVHERDVSFGAALHLPRELLPEAILERISFVSKKSISDGLKDLLAIKGPLQSQLEAAVEDYVRVCQLRHCAVHRFGKLGTSNAISLGLETHKALLEKPLLLDYVALQNAIAIATCLVKTLNNFLFNEMISRLPPASWTGDYKKDRQLFVKYYSVFCDKVSAHRTAQPAMLYRQMMTQRTLWSNGKPF